MNKSEWITTVQAAELTGYSPSHIRRLAREGRVEGIKMGREWLIHRPSLLKYAETVKRLHSVAHE